MKFEIITLFPDYFDRALKQSLIGKAIEKKLFDIDIINLRDFATDKHRTVDDTPYGGGGGMVMMLEPLDNCLRSLGYSHRTGGRSPSEKERIALTSAAGRKFGQARAIEYSLCDRLTVICGHYLGIDERTTELYRMDELSIGDYILTGGEPAALVIIDAVARLIPGVLGNFESALNDSYMEQLLGAPSYTRPAEYEGLRVPRQLVEGNHSEIARFRRREAIRKCLINRPDLLKGADLSDEEIEYIKSLDDKVELE
ncbi:MAG: tRNA (guanosine(37)-N1)-methyltransferase TrmD [Candidatus Zixiibacteriota bacterium]|nr:MAG: tRNA (guanosine(37)-N1)-methyltransferase TrmD [candidate division Zixibacteria bacterium]